nr:SDR family NAD(P)-dependent oxidoreductase [Azomonas macrocytogenes]
MSNSKVVVITGVSSGIGRATAIKFATQGCRVFGTVRNLEKTQAIPGVALIEMDIRDKESVQRGIQSIIAQTTRIDVLVNSAGVTQAGAMEEASTDEAKTLFDTNLFGLLRTIPAVLLHMRAQRSGRIVNVSSMLGFLPAPYMALYSASKHAVEGLSARGAPVRCSRRTGRTIVHQDEPGSQRTANRSQNPGLQRTVRRRLPGHSEECPESARPRWRSQCDRQCGVGGLENATHAQRGGISSGQTPPLHACRAGRERPEKNVWAGLSQSVPSRSCGHSMGLAPRDQSHPMSRVAP